MAMPKRAVSLTLDEDNLLWLRGRTTATGNRSLSQTVDQIVSDARQARGVPSKAVPSVVGTVKISEDDPDLERADDFIRSWMNASLARPLVVRESKAAWRRKTLKSSRRG